MPELEPLGMLNSRWTSTSANFCCLKRFAVRPLGPLSQAPLPSLASSFFGFFGSISTSTTSSQSPCGTFQADRSLPINSSAARGLVWPAAAAKKAPHGHAQTRALTVDHLARNDLEIMRLTSRLTTHHSPLATDQRLL